MIFKFKKIPATYRNKFDDIDGYAVGLYLDDRIEWTSFEVRNILKYPEYNKVFTYNMYHDLINKYNFVKSKIDIDVII